MLLSIGFIPYFTIFAVPAIALLFMGMLILFAPQMGRVLGGLVIVVCTFAVLLLPTQVEVLFGYPIGAYYGFIPALTALLAGTVLAGYGGISVLVRNSPKPQNEAQNRIWQPGPAPSQATHG